LKPPDEPVDGNLAIKAITGNLTRTIENRELTEFYRLSLDGSASL
jgi:hypothetical protein